MCGIIALFGEEVEVSSYLLTHRGPDDYSTRTLGKCRMDFYRLSINDLTDAGMQPFREGKHMLVCNGEIYNHRELRTGSEKSTSDCAVLIPLIRKSGIVNAVKQINGDFALVITDGKRIIAARDPVGVRPLFYTRYAEDSIAFASEAKALLRLGAKIEIFPPGHIYDSYLDSFVCYHTGYYPVFKVTDPVNHKHIREVLETAVHERINNTERDIGFLLSGGLIVVSSFLLQLESLVRLRHFQLGWMEVPISWLRGKLQSIWIQTTRRLSLQWKKVFHIVNDVIHTLESYDTTTVRASTPMWLLCKYIKQNTKCRYIFSGEGSDEILGGYLYFHNAPVLKSLH